MGGLEMYTVPSCTQLRGFMEVIAKNNCSRVFAQVVGTFDESTSATVQNIRTAPLSAGG